MYTCTQQPATSGGWGHVGNEKTHAGSPHVLFPLHERVGLHGLALALGFFLCKALVGKILTLPQAIKLTTRVAYTQTAACLCDCGSRAMLC